MPRLTALALAGAATIALIATPGAAQTLIPDYPDTRATDTSEVLFGQTVADPYRWLENDVRTDPQVAQWVEAQNVVTDAYLATLPGTEWFKERLAQLIDYERFGIPNKAGERYFFSYNSGLMNQSQYFVRDGWDGEARLLLDPNQWSADNATALADTAPSKSGRYLAYAIQDGGSDWRTIKVLDVDTGEEMGDAIEWAKFTGISWIGDEGFFYSRFPATEEGQDFQSLNYNQKVYFHRLGTPQSADELVYETPDAKEQGHGVGVSDDGRWAFVYSSTGTDNRNELRVIDLTRRAGDGWAARPLITGFDNSWSPIASLGDMVYFMTNTGAPRYRILRADLTADTLEWEEVVAQSDQPISGASIIGDRLVVEYMKDASSRAVYHDLDGKETGTLDLPGIGSIGGLNGDPGDSETFYSFTSFNQPHEYGKEWHDGGRLANKQNVFDDFIAAGEFLKANGYTSASGLAIQGGSNGGLLVGAVVNQRPDLFDAGNAAVGVMDMLRFDRWTAGRYWVDDYGYPDREADFAVLRSYSPLHNIRSGVNYPALLVTTADTDDRVVPGHSFKYTAALQAAELGEEPHLIRIETRAGHGSGKPTDKIIDEYGDILAFLAHHTGLDVPPAEQPAHPFR